MIIYKVIHVRAADHCDFEEVCSEFESFRQALFWATELTRLELPVRWEFEFIDAPKQYEFNF